MRSLEMMEQPRVAFLCELYKRSEGDPRQGVPYDELVDALGFDEHVTKRLQRELEGEGLVELTVIPPFTTVGRTVMDPAQRHSRRQSISITSRGVHLVEEILARCAHSDSPTPPAAPSSWAGR